GGAIAEPAYAAAALHHSRPAGSGPSRRPPAARARYRARTETTRSGAHWAPAFGYRVPLLFSVADARPRRLSRAMAGSRTGPFRGLYFSHTGPPDAGPSSSCRDIRPGTN